MAAARVALHHRITDGIRITARPAYVAGRSNPGARQFVFTYRIRIENIGAHAARLMTRRWLIHDEGATDTIVEGDGVIGEQPRIAPGKAHEYSSFCVLTSPVGWMEGSYHFVRDDGSEFDAIIPRVSLVAESDGGWGR
ncbi:MAG: Co2+/Mg2+ efflux protein ApaG [Gemmatimonadota bacterium]